MFNRARAVTRSQCTMHCASKYRKEVLLTRNFSKTGQESGQSPNKQTNKPGESVSSAGTERIVDGKGQPVFCVWFEKPIRTRRLTFKSMYKETGCENANCNDLRRDPACVSVAVSPWVSRNTIAANEETHNFPAISIQCNQEYKML